MRRIAAYGGKWIQSTVLIQWGSCEKASISQVHWHSDISRYSLSRWIKVNNGIEDVIRREMLKLLYYRSPWMIHRLFDNQALVFESYEETSSRGSSHYPFSYDLGWRSIWKLESHGVSMWLQLWSRTSGWAKWVRMMDWILSRIILRGIGWHGTCGARHNAATWSSNKGQLGSGYKDIMATFQDAYDHLQDYQAIGSIRTALFNR